MIPAPPSDGKAPAIKQCLTCDRTDPLKSASVEAWLKGSLRPPA
jgi:hypothetical protein